ncbi:MAG: hypothetical protein ACLFNO_01910 [Parcubacteria group bacterium]
MKIFKQIDNKLTEKKIKKIDIIIGVIAVIFAEMINIIIKSSPIFLDFSFGLELYYFTYPAILILIILLSLITRRWQIIVGMGIIRLIIDLIRFLT